jgi:hypothetical protein
MRLGKCSLGKSKLDFLLEKSNNLLKILKVHLNILHENNAIKDHKI